MVDMVKSKAIVRLTSEQLSKLLGAHGVTARKKQHEDIQDQTNHAAAIGQPALLPRGADSIG